MRVLCCGDRWWDNWQTIERVLGTLYKVNSDAIIVQGECRGADLMCKEVGIRLFGRDQVEGYPADWHQYGRAAGVLRNRQMISDSRSRARVDGHELLYGLAFHAHIQRSKGTKNMLGLMQYEGISYKLFDK